MFLVYLVGWFLQGLDCKALISELPLHYIQFPSTCLPGLFIPTCFERLRGNLDLWGHTPSHLIILSGNLQDVLPYDPETNLWKCGPGDALTT